MLQAMEEKLNDCEGEIAMKSKKVVLWGHNEVLGDAVEKFLSPCKEWEVVKVVDKQSGQQFLEQMETDQPDVIIVYETEQVDAAIYPYALLHTQPEIKVIAISLENNYMEVFDKHRVWVNNVSDLFSAIDQ